MVRTSNARAGEITRSYDERVNAHDVDGILELCSDDITMIWSNGAFDGKDSVRQAFEELFTAFPDYRQESDLVVADDDHATWELRAIGHFSGGPFTGFEPTGKDSTVHMAKIFTVTEGRIVGIRAYFDQMEFAREVGLLPQEDSTGDQVMASMMNTVAKVRRRLER